MKVYGGKTVVKLSFFRLFDVGILEKKSGGNTIWSERASFSNHESVSQVLVQKKTGFVFIKSRL